MTETTTSIEARRPAPGVSSALADVIDAGQRLVVDRIDLLRLEVKRTGERILAGAFGAIAGTALLGYAWVVLMAAVIVALEGPLSPAVSRLLVGVANLVLGAVLVWAGAQRMRAPRGATGDGAGGSR